MSKPDSLWDWAIRGGKGYLGLLQSVPETITDTELQRLDKLLQELKEVRDRAKEQKDKQ